MQLDGWMLSPMALWTLLFLVAFFALGGVALWRLRARRQAALAAYTDDSAAPSAAADVAELASVGAAGAARAATAAGSGQIADAVDAAGAMRQAQAQREAQARGQAQAEAEARAQAAAEAKAEAEASSHAAAQAQRQALKAGLSRTRVGFLGRIGTLLGGRVALDDAVLDDIEEVLLTADVGVGMAMRLMDALRDAHRAQPLDGVEAVRSLLRQQLQTALTLPQANAGGALAPADDAARPKVILFVGVNGVGKTTTIGKLAAKLAGEGQKVLLAAGDTFRAAAAEQLSVWGERTGARVVRGDAGADPASVMFNAVEAAKQGAYDIVLADTAGRLHTKVELMDEIKKVRRAIGKVRAGAPDETWLVVDATTGQNALQQAKEFHQALQLTGVILTKLDGTAKGGVVVAIVEALQVPVLYVGVGETAETLLPFSAEQFVEALFEPAESA
jgi:fused signal recognition particle receptor